MYQALPESRIAWHTASTLGNQDYYGIEICQSIGASNAQFLANEQAAFQETARLLKKWGLPANRNTVRLHREFSSTICPHRSTALHAGVDPQYHAVSEKQLLMVKDYFIKQIRAYMDGEIPTSTVSKYSSSSSNTVKPVASGWRRNKYGSYWKDESARFTNGSQPIAVRTTGPFRSMPLGYYFQPGGWVDYTSVILQDYHVWLEYKWQGKLYYIPVRKWDGTPPPNQVLGDLWGTISS